MKQFFTSIILSLCAITASASLHVYVKNTDTLLKGDTKITITEFEEEFGDWVATVNGQVRSDETHKISVTITRSNTDFEDSFCTSSGQCINSNKELTQNINFTVSNPMESDITIHYYPAATGTETIAYTFSDGVNPSITLTVDYTFQGLGIEEVQATQHTQGIYTILGQRIAATDLHDLPKGIYIVNGKKFIKQ